MLLEGLRDSSGNSAWREFDGRYRPLLMAVAHRLGLDSMHAEDAAQETLTTFLVEYRNGRYSREKGRLRDWLAGIMRHKVRDVQREMYRQKALAPDSLPTNAAEQGVDMPVEAAMEEEWSRWLLRECCQRVRGEVTQQAFESFELFVLQQLPASQVAKRLGISADLVYQNKRRILQRIRQLLPEVEATW
jgi:RNA polymerase sigma-70 factor (ECF subfamily)